MSKRLSTEEFINKASKVHGDKYDYSKVDYINTNTKVCIICPEHGEFWMAPNDHLRGHGCRKCSGRELTTEIFIEMAKKIHGDKYDYSKVEYNGALEDVCIICPKHGEFWQKPSNHTRKKNPSGCPICGRMSSIEKHKGDKEIFVERAKKIRERYTC